MVNGESIWNYQFQKTDNNHITLDPYLEEFLAIQSLHVSYEFYISLPGSHHWATPEQDYMTKSKLIAVYRTLAQLENVKQDLQWRTT